MQIASAPIHLHRDSQQRSSQRQVESSAKKRSLNRVAASDGSSEPGYRACSCALASFSGFWRLRPRFMKWSFSSHLLIPHSAAD
jgi:hypothetical protein